MLADSPQAVTGSDRPRIAPPRPARSSVAEYRAEAAACGIELMPHQDVAATYIEAIGPDDRWLYPEIAVIEARQNGKTELLVPFIVRRLRMGRRIMHAAQNRELPREVHDRVATIMVGEYRGELRRKPRYGSGQETIEMANGGRYHVVAATRGGARGNPNDDVIIDEVRELDTYDFLGAAKPTLAQSRNPQILYLSNAGEDTSVVLNGIRQRAGVDPKLAYLEWSADPRRSVEDREGWREANPAIGRLPGRDMMAYLEDQYRAYQLTGTLGIFETEHLCRWVSSTRERFVDEYLWASCMGPLGDPLSPVLAVSMTPDGKRAAAAMAWQRPDGTVALRLVYDVTGNPIDVKRLGEDMDADARRLGIKRVGYDPLTDAELAKYFVKGTSEKVTGQAFANASAQFVNLVTAKRIRWQDGDGIGADLLNTARRAHDETGHFEAVRMTDDRPIPAALASIRAVWLASGPDVPSPRFY
jgi:hypothetical protein